MDDKKTQKAGASQIDMFDVYCKQVRCVLEFGVAVWAPGLTQAEATQIERVQKCALHVIMGASYGDYENALDLLKLVYLFPPRS